MNPQYTKKQIFNSYELAMFFSAFGLKLFARPKQGDILSLDSFGSSCTFFFNTEYYEDLKKDMFKASREGKFANSNAEDEWSHLLFRLNNATDVDENESIPEVDYYEIMRKYWGE